jgi:hypothetical protein
MEHLASNLSRDTDYSEVFHGVLQSFQRYPMVLSFQILSSSSLRKDSILVYYTV